MGKEGEKLTTNANHPGSGNGEINRDFTEGGQGQKKGVQKNKAKRKDN